jgi:hypothetical protein
VIQAAPLAMPKVINITDRKIEQGSPIGGPAEPLDIGDLDDPGTSQPLCLCRRLSALKLP